MPWVLLVVAGVLESVWALALPATQGFTRPAPSAFTLVFMLASVFLLALAARTIPVGTAYAVWVGLGAVGTALYGALFRHEPMPPTRAFFLVLLVVAIAGLEHRSGARP